MKANSLFNPFNKIAGKEAALWGILFLILIGIIGYFSSMVFPATLDAKYNPELKHSTKGILLLLQSSFVTILIFYISGKLFSKSVRLIDIVGTILFSKWPYILVALSGFFGSSLMKIISGQVDKFDAIMITLNLIIVIPCIILYVTLLYNAFKVSTGLKSTKLGVVFTFTLIIAEIVSLITAYIVLQ